MYLYRVRLVDIDLTFPNAVHRHLRQDWIEFKTPKLNFAAGDIIQLPGEKIVKAVDPETSGVSHQMMSYDLKHSYLCQIISIAWQSAENSEEAIGLIQAIGLKKLPNASASLSLSLEAGEWGVER